MTRKEIEQRIAELREEVFMEELKERSYNYSRVRALQHEIEMLRNQLS